MKYKYFIAGILLTICMILLIKIIYCFNMNYIINIKSIEGYLDELNNVSDEINNIKDETCKVSLNNMLLKIENTYYEENISYEEYYIAYYDDNTIINLYNTVLTDCNIEENTNTYMLLITSTTYPEYIKNLYENKYKILFNISHTDIDELGTYTNKYLELKVLKELIGEINE